MSRDLPGPTSDPLYYVRQLTRTTKVERTKVTRLMNRSIDFAPVCIMAMTQSQQLHVGCRAGRLGDCPFVKVDDYASASSAKIFLHNRLGSRHKKRSRQCTYICIC